ncbi:MAG: class I SAM-dependent methyltransferase [Terriglobia bacterium]
MTSKRDPGSDTDYARRMDQELEHYKSVTNVSDLPPICYFWLDRYVRPKLRAVFGVSEVVEFYAKHILQFRATHPEQPVEIASLGAGNADIEVGIAKALLEREFTDFRFLCLDINPDMLQRGKELTSREQLSDHFRFFEVDLAEWRPEKPLAVVMAQHTLHHMVNLEETFANVKRAIGAEGYFLTADMVGRNGHMRWPEALEIVQDIWRKMPDRYKYNHQLKRFEETYDNWDCSQEGFEGIRAQEILPLLVKNFHFEAFVAFGNLPDIFVDRGFGHNFDVKNPEDTEFIDRIGALNDRLISEGKIKPTQIVAAMRSHATRPTRCYQHWTPEFCIRLVEKSPSQHDPA